MLSNTLQFTVYFALQSQNLKLYKRTKGLEKTERKILRVDRQMGLLAGLLNLKFEIQILLMAYE